MKRRFLRFIPILGGHASVAQVRPRTARFFDTIRKCLCAPKTVLRHHFVYGTNIFQIGIISMFTIFTVEASGIESVAGEPPVKLYVMAGQSNFGWSIRIDGMQQHASEVLDWIASDQNDVLYSWKKHETGKGSSSEGFVRLDSAEGMYAPDHLVAYHLSRYWEKQNPQQRIAIIKVQKGATSLIQHWNPGGRKHWGEHYYKEGPLHATLVDQINAGIAQLEAAGIAWEGAGFFWYQGEGDAYDAGAKYAQLFKDLVYGGEFETNAGTHRVQGVLPMLQNPEAPVIPVRISWHLHTVTRENAPPPGMWAKRTRAEWEPHLVQVRDALTQFATAHNGHDAAWVDVDDLPLKDRYHYDQSEAITIGHRMAEAYLALMTAGE